MPARHQSCGKLFGEGLKPAIASRNAASAENRDSRRFASARAQPILAPPSIAPMAGRMTFGLLAGALTGS